MPGRLLLLALTALAAVEAYGLRTPGLFQLRHWNPDGPWPLIQFAGIYAACAMVVLIFAPWVFARLCGFGIVILSAVVLGPLAVVAVAFFLLSAWAAGGFVTALPHWARLVAGI